jgi:hypothetical protein
MLKAIVVIRDHMMQPLAPMRLHLEIGIHKNGPTAKPLTEAES